MRINKMDVRVMNQSADDPNSGKDPGKWLRHKTFSGSYLFRIWEVKGTGKSVLSEFLISNVNDQNDRKNERNKSRPLFYISK